MISRACCPSFVDFPVLRPTFGSFDGHLFKEVPVYGVGPFLGVGANGTTLVPNISDVVGKDTSLDNTLSIRASQVATTNGVTNGDGTYAYSETIQDVRAYGQFNTTWWDTISEYQEVNDPTITRRPNVANDRAAWSEFSAPQINLGELQTPSGDRYAFTSDLLNNFYYGRSHSNQDIPAYLTYDNFNFIVTDTAGAYNFGGEAVKK